MDKYRKIFKSKSDKEPLAENEVRITQSAKVGKSISYVALLFQEKQLKSVQLKAMGNAISKLVSVVEIVKRRVAGLHQLNEISSLEVIDVYEPLEEGLDRIEEKRSLTCLHITLSLEKLDTTHYGYQPPLDPSEVSTQAEFHQRVNERRQKNDEDGTEGQNTSTRGRGARSSRGGRGGRGSSSNEEITSSPKKSRASRGGRGGRGGRGSSSNDEITSSPSSGRGGGRSSRGGRGGRGSSSNDETVSSPTSGRGGGRSSRGGRGRRRGGRGRGEHASTPAAVATEE